MLKFILILKIKTYLAHLILIFNTMQEGTVKFFNVTKGFGFIIPANGDSEIFVHSTGLIDEIRENDKVQYEVANGKKGLNAVNVKVI
jgi:CspA family cold shock protein